MHTWMRDHGERRKPLLLPEFSILYPYDEEPGETCSLQHEIGDCLTPERVTSFLHSSKDYLESAIDTNLGYSSDDDRLIQQ